MLNTDGLSFKYVLMLKISYNISHYLTYYWCSNTRYLSFVYCFIYLERRVIFLVYFFMLKLFSLNRALIFNVSDISRVCFLHLKISV